MSDANFWENQVYLGVIPTEPTVNTERPVEIIQRDSVEPYGLYHGGMGAGIGMMLLAAVGAAAYGINRFGKYLFNNDENAEEMKKSEEERKTNAEKFKTREKETEQKRIDTLVSRNSSRISDLTRFTKTF